jgi:hypothetical protein
MAKKIFLAALIFVCFAKCTFGMQFSNEKESDVVVKIFSVSFFEVLNSENPTNWVEICKEFQNLEIIKLCFEDPKKNMFGNLFLLRVLLQGKMF